jgi:hypothetical protein
MPSTRETLENETLEQLADRMQDGPNAQRHYYAALAELERRKTEAELEASNAQTEAAEATKATAEYTRKNVRAMWWSVAAIAVGSTFTGVAAVLQILSWAAGR